MAVNQSNQRIRLKRSTVAGVTPSLPGAGVTNYYDHTLGGWGNNTCYVGEVFGNVADGKVWWMSSGGSVLLGSTGTSVDFTDLNDTPASYTNANYGVRVNSGATGLEFYELTANTFLGLPDTPSTFETGKTLISNATETALEWTDTISGFTMLSDTPASITSDYLVKGNSAGDALEMVDKSNILCDLDTIQTIHSAKTFNDVITFNSGITTNSMVFSGRTINYIQNSTGLTSASPNKLVSEYAVKNYIDAQVYNSSMAQYITLGSDQTITGTKTFNAPVIYNSGFTINNLNVNNDFRITGNTYTDLTSYYYYGDSSLDGSFRQYIAPTGLLTFERRDGGSWSDNVFGISQSGVTIGSYTGSTGYYSFSLGFENQADGQYSFAGGSNSKASASRCFAFGGNCEANTTNAFAIGSYTNASGTSSFCGGEGSVTDNLICSGRTSFNFSGIINNGIASGVTGNRSAILGGTDQSCANDYSVVLGSSGMTSNADHTVFMRMLNVSDKITSDGSEGYTGTINIGGDDCIFKNGIFIGKP